MIYRNNDHLRYAHNRIPALESVTPSNNDASNRRGRHETHVNRLGLLGTIFLSLFATLSELKGLGIGTRTKSILGNKSLSIEDKDIGLRKILGDTYETLVCEGNSPKQHFEETYGNYSRKIEKLASFFHVSIKKRFHPSRHLKRNFVVTISMINALCEVPGSHGLAQIRGGLDGYIKHEMPLGFHPKKKIETFE